MKRYLLIPRKPQPILTLMADYSADGIWWNQKPRPMPYNTNLLKKRIQKWQKQFELFNFFMTTEEENLKIIKSRVYKNWIKEGKMISIKLRKIIKPSIKIVFFH